MKIQINTDNNIAGSEELAKQAEATVESTLGHLAEHITRVEVHLSDENSNKGGSHDKRCLMEARLEGHQPIAVSDEAESIGQAIDGAAEKLKKSLDHTLGRLRDR
ncbi:HPF/RaiA family ribosome-associated protein [Halothiobacillus sp.]|jgi:ribosome-associated translation inhibitor RaiA|uniref:HPF/RaiA family ribosome-associated protein n=1 Tax=Halothiobacillus sp. TaxID=1891311 RepID=UPI002AD2AB42|nr:HPF/RaiA family ribosome-associated protein [Halothiobacillus sp.]